MKTINKCLVWLLVWAGFAMSSVASGEPLPVLLEGDQARTGLGRYVQYRPVSPDETPYAPPISEQETLPWYPVRDSIVNLGFKTQAYWFRMNLVTSSDIAPDWILEQAYPLIDQLNVFLYEGNKLVDNWSTGDEYPFSKRPILHNHFLFPLHLEPNRRYTLYLYVANSEAMELNLSLWERTEFGIQDNHRAVIDGVFYGLLLIMAAYNLALYLNVRDRSYLYYVLYVVSMLLFFLSQKGVLFQLLFPDMPRLHHYSIPLVIVSILFAVAMFFKEFLKLDQQLPRVWLLVKLLMLAQAVAGAMVFVISYHIAIIAVIAIAAVASVLGLSIAIILSWRGQKTAQMLLIGWGFLIACIVFMTLSKMGIVYHEFMSQYGLRLGTSFEILIFSFALSYRINEERYQKNKALQLVDAERLERLKAQELALAHEKEARLAKEEALRQQQKLNENLEKMVRERTEELEKTLAELEKANRELEILSSKDGLTGVFNRRYFDVQLQEEWLRSRREQTPLSLLMLDIDHFKSINDTRGHQCGDAVLREIARLLEKQVCRPADVIARYGGEEFAVLLPNTPAEGAAHLAGVLVRAVAEHPFIWSDGEFGVTVSIGLHCQTQFNADNDMNALVALADKALYQAKETGRNRFVTL